MRLEDETICTQCRRSNRLGARYCKYCGAQLVQAMGEEVPPAKRGLFPYLLVVLAVVSLVLAAVYVYDELIAGGELRGRAVESLEETVGSAYDGLIASSFAIGRGR